MSEPRTRRFGDEVDELLMDHAANLGVTPGVVIQRAVEEYLGYRSRPDQMHVPEVGPEPLTSNVARNPTENEARDLVPAAHVEPRDLDAPRIRIEAPHVPAYAQPRVSDDGSIDTDRIRIRTHTALRCTCIVPTRDGTHCGVCGGVL